MFLSYMAKDSRNSAACNGRDPSIPINNRDNPLMTCPQTSLIWAILQQRLPSQVALSWQWKINRIVLRHRHYMSELVVWKQISKDRFRDMRTLVTKCFNYIYITVTKIPNKQHDGEKIYFDSQFRRTSVWGRGNRKVYFNYNGAGSRVCMSDLCPCLLSVMPFTS